MSALRIYKISDAKTLDYVGSSPADNLRKNYDGEAYTNDSAIGGDLRTALMQTRLYDRCYESIDARWMLELLSKDGKVLHSIVWSNLSTCSFVDGIGYSISPAMELYVKRTFGFLNM